MVIEWEPGTYEWALAQSRAEGTTWRCPRGGCDTENPGDYDCCHACQFPGNT